MIACYSIFFNLILFLLVARHCNAIQYGTLKPAIKFGSLKSLLSTFVGFPYTRLRTRPTQLSMRPGPRLIKPKKVRPPYVPEKFSRIFPANPDKVPLLSELLEKLGRPILSIKNLIIVTGHLINMGVTREMLPENLMVQVRKFLEYGKYLEVSTVEVLSHLGLMGFTIDDFNEDVMTVLLTHVKSALLAKKLDVRLSWKLFMALGALQFNASHFDESHMLGIEYTIERNLFGESNKDVSTTFYCLATLNLPWLSLADVTKILLSRKLASATPMLSFDQLESICEHLIKIDLNYTIMNEAVQQSIINSVGIYCRNPTLSMTTLFTRLSVLKFPMDVWPDSTRKKFEDSISNSTTTAV